MTLVEDLAGSDPQLEDLVSRAAALRPLLEANAAEGEQHRRVSAESIDAISDAGLFRIMTPKRFGGFETDVRTHLAVSAEIAKGDGATGWVAALTNVCAWLVGLYPDRAQTEVWGASPDARERPGCSRRRCRRHAPRAGSW